MQIRAEMKVKLGARSIPPVTPLNIVPKTGLLKLDRSTAYIRFDYKNSVAMLQLAHILRQIANHDAKCSNCQTCMLFTLLKPSCNEAYTCSLRLQP